MPKDSNFKQFTLASKEDLFFPQHFALPAPLKREETLASNPENPYHTHRNPAY